MMKRSAKRISYNIFQEAIMRVNGPFALSRRSTSLKDERNVIHGGRNGTHQQWFVSSGFRWTKNY